MGFLPVILMGGNSCTHVHVRTIHNPALLLPLIRFLWNDYVCDAMRYDAMQPHTSTAVATH